MFFIFHSQITYIAIKDTQHNILASTTENESALEFDPSSDPMPSLELRQDSSTPEQPPHQQPFVAISSDLYESEKISRKRSRQDDPELKCIPVNKKMKKPVVLKENFLSICPDCSFEAMNPFFLEIHQKDAH